MQSLDEVAGGHIRFIHPSSRDGPRCGLHSPPTSFSSMAICCGGTTVCQLIGKSKSHAKSLFNFPTASCAAGSLGRSTAGGLPDESELTAWISYRIGLDSSGDYSSGPFSLPCEGLQDREHCPGVRALADNRVSRVEHFAWPV